MSESADGTVEEVTLRVTRIRSESGEVIITPNGQITTLVVIGLFLGVLAHDAKPDYGTGEHSGYRRAHAGAELTG